MPSKYNNIKLKHYDDGIPSVLRKKTLYKKLHFYRKSEVLYQLTCVFCEPMATAQSTRWFRRQGP